MSEWISVKDRLPEPGRNVLIYALSGWMDVRYFNIAARGWYPGGLPLESSTHWMPLPAPPTET